MVDTQFVFHVRKGTCVILAMRIDQWKFLLVKMFFGSNELSTSCLFISPSETFVRKLTFVGDVDNWRIAEAWAQNRSTRILERFYFSSPTLPYNKYN